MVDNRVELRGYTHYGTGLNDPADIVSYTEKIGLKGISITDIGVVAGFCIV